MTKRNRTRTFFGVDVAFNHLDACHVIELWSRDDTSSGGGGGKATCSLVVLRSDRSMPPRSTRFSSWSRTRASVSSPVHLPSRNTITRCTISGCNFEKTERRERFTVVFFSHNLITFATVRSGMCSDKPLQHEK